ncbi:MAG TPA: TraR/DksA C4-type zinc finger protein [Longimicrobiales bacterium]|nr:TraR/DksA C4-type zinc finger protein [Longimicrobiales bacterium]
MTDTERQHLEQRLLQERDRVERALRRSDETTRISTEEDGELTQYKQHLADEGTDTMEQEKALLLLGREGELHEAITEALRRLYKEPEEFGRCDNCGADIEMERLELVPWAHLCLACQRAAEAGD